MMKINYGDARYYVLSFLSDGHEATTRDIRKMLLTKMTIHPSNVAYALKTLRDEGRIHYFREGKQGLWMITDLGQHLRRSLEYYKYSPEKYEYAERRV